jgi:hypothetical protein
MGINSRGDEVWDKARVHSPSSSPERQQLNMAKDSLSFKILTFLLVVLIVGGGWFIKRKLNFFLMYEDQTERVICKMVKLEHLTDEGLKFCRELEP